MANEIGPIDLGELNNEVKGIEKLTKEEIQKIVAEKFEYFSSLIKYSKNYGLKMKAYKAGKGQEGTFACGLGEEGNKDFQKFMEGKIKFEDIPEEYFEPKYLYYRLPRLLTKNNDVLGPIVDHELEHAESSDYGDIIRNSREAVLHNLPITTVGRFMNAFEDIYMGKKQINKGRAKKIGVLNLYRDFYKTEGKENLRKELKTEQFASLAIYHRLKTEFPDDFNVKIKVNKDVKQEFENFIQHFDEIVDINISNKERIKKKNEILWPIIDRLRKLDMETLKKKKIQENIENEQKQQQKGQLEGTKNKTKDDLKGNLESDSKQENNGQQGNNETGNQNPSSNESGDQNPSNNESGNQNPSSNESGNQNPSNNESGNQNPSNNESGDQNPSNNESGDQNPSNNESGNQNPSSNESGDQNPSNNESGDQNPSSDESGNQNPSSNESGNQNPSSNESGNQNPSSNESGNQNPSNNESGDQNPSSNESGNQNPSNNESGDQNPSNNETGNTDSQKNSSINNSSSDNGTINNGGGNIENGSGDEFDSILDSGDDENDYYDSELEKEIEKRLNEMNEKEIKKMMDKIIDDVDKQNIEEHGKDLEVQKKLLEKNESIRDKIRDLFNSTSEERQEKRQKKKDEEYADEQQKEMQKQWEKIVESVEKREESLKQEQKIQKDLDTIEEHTHEKDFNEMEKVENALNEIEKVANNIDVEDIKKRLKEKIENMREYIEQKEKIYEKEIQESGFTREEEHLYKEYLEIENEMKKILDKFIKQLNERIPKLKEFNLEGGYTSGRITDMNDAGKKIKLKQFGERFYSRYEEKETLEINLGICLSIDNSGSMESDLDETRKLVVFLGLLCEKWGIPFHVNTFANGLKIIKDTDDDFKSRKGKLMKELYAYGGTNMGLAVNKDLMVLKEVKSTHPDTVFLPIFITDGEANQGVTGYELIELIKGFKGLSMMVGIGIDEKTLKTWYPDSKVIGLKNSGEIMTKLLSSLKDFFKEKQSKIFKVTTE